ncbi:MAG: cysteine desulfurase [Clostridiales bacterium]|nr:cysteine desulfurase [Clostridiales bacterium]
MVYLDNAATTKPSSESLKKAEVFNTVSYFNPSGLYSGGISALKEIKNAKEYILTSLRALNKEVCFTSCGSESDNLAIFGLSKRGYYCTTKGEHSAVYKSFLELKNRGKEVFFFDLNKDGSVNVEKTLDFVKNNEVGFVSIMHVNNETGAINDVNYIAKEIKKINPKIIFHVDGVQAYGKIEYAISNDIDLYSISAHKINALKGVGALIYKKGLSLTPLIFGGGQENGLRSGTENVFGIKVFEFSAKEKYENIKNNYQKVLELNNYIRNNLDKENFEIISSENASPYILTVSAKGLRGETVMHLLEKEGFIVGNGSACSSKNRYSRVIEACGYKKEILEGVIRISFNPENTIDEIKEFVKAFNLTVSNLKKVMQ